jgi:hypothetical protein
VLEDKVNAITDRFDTIVGVDLLSGDQPPNPLFPSIFAAFSATVVAVLVLSRVRERAPSAVEGARRVFVHLGALEKPAVIDGSG